MRISAGRCSTGLTDAWATGNQLVFISHPLNHVAKNPKLGEKKKKIKARTVQFLDMELNGISPISGKREARKAGYFQGALILILGVCMLASPFGFISALCHSDSCQNSYRSSVVRCLFKPTGKGEISCLSQNLSAQM